MKSTPLHTLKFKTDAFPCSKNTQTWYEARGGYSEQFLQLGRPQIPTEFKL
jgi:hypothetical protein